MPEKSSSRESSSGLRRLASGLGSATPAPLFYLDAAGRSHALNDLALDPAAGRLEGDAILSPVGSAREQGYVVAYPGTDGPAGDPALIAAMVALTAELVGRSLQGGGPALAAPAETDPFEAGRQALAMTGDVRLVADVVADACVAATGAASVVVFARESGDALEPLAARGAAATVSLEPIACGRGLLGWAATAGREIAVESLFRLPAEAPRDTHALAPMNTWLAPPFALLPLCTGSQVVGLLALAGLPSRETGGSAAAACDLVRAFGDRAALAVAGTILVRQARREERAHREVQIARQIQECLLPPRELRFDGLEAAGECRAAAQVGGDGFAFRQGLDGAVTACVLDVAGHGIGAALGMALVRAALAGEMARCDSPKDVLERANDLINGDVAGTGMFATAALVRVDARAGEMVFANAGHPPPVHWSQDAGAFVEHAERGVPLGLFADARHAESRSPFGEGDVLVFVTDGVLEAAAADGEPFGRARLTAAVRSAIGLPAPAVASAVWSAVSAHAGGGALRDDATVVVLRRSGAAVGAPAGGGERGDLVAARPMRRSRRKAGRSASDSSNS